MPDGANDTGDGAAFAWGEMLTVSPSTMVTVRGAPLPEKSAIVGYPFTVQVLGPELVTVTTPVMVPAAPWDPPAEAVILSHTAATAVGLVVEAALVEEVVDDDELVVAWWVVVVVDCFGLGLLLHAARQRPAPASKASAQ